MSDAKISGICGVDEAGRGPVIGPMVVAGVKVDDESALIKLRVRDSKKCTKARREKLANKIKEICEWRVERISAFEIDKMRERMTINEIEVLYFSKIIADLRPSVAYVDSADANEMGFAIALKSHLRACMGMDGEKISVISRHGADDIYAVVSAASIIAKVERDAEIKRIEEELGVEIGSGYPSDKRTVDFLLNWVREHGELPPYTRKSWKTVKKIIYKVGHLDI
ncbi:MAG: ribonuclease HII [Thermoplasmata archaeon]|nr:MAG: ribonuclease HII [Thermoplasmata archaeon]